MKKEQPSAGTVRLAYIDWMRGLACLLMFQTHCYDSWLTLQARRGTFSMYSQLLGTLPAPLFLFLAGISFALVTDKLRQKKVPANQVARQTIVRGAEVFGFALLFRLQQWLFSLGWAPWTDLLRVDILNTIGISMMLMGAVCWTAAMLLGGGPVARLRIATVILALLLAAAISLLTPPLWTTYRPRFLPWPLESYVNGIHLFAEPKGWFFPIFPWAGFAFAGLAVGLALLTGWARRRETFVFCALGIGGVALVLASRWLDRQPRQFYAVYSYWTTSPEFFLLRVGLLLMISLAAYAWCRWGAAQLGWSPLVQLGQTSLMVYWVHIEFVYGGLKILPSHANSVGVASFGLVYITVFMLVLSALKTRLKGRGWWLATRPARSTS